MTTGDEEDVDSGWDVEDEGTDRKTRSFDTKALLALSLDSTKQVPQGVPGTPESPTEGQAPPSSRKEPTSAVPTLRARSFTPKVSNAAQEARRAEEGLRKSGESRKSTRPVPVQRLPNVRSQEFVPPPNTPPPAPPQAAGKTSLRFPNKTPARLEAQRRQTVKFSTKEIRAKDIEEEPPVTVRAPLPTDPDSAHVRATRRPPSNPLLDLHLPDDVAFGTPKLPTGTKASTKSAELAKTPLKTPKPVAKGTLRERLAKVFPESTLSPLPPKPRTSDSFSDLPIDEVLENVRQSQMPPRMPSKPPSVDDDVEDRPSAIPDVEVVADSSDMNVEDLERLEKALTAVREKMEKKDFSGALLRAEAVLEAWPDSVDAKTFAGECRLKIQQMYIQKIGSGRHMLRIAVDSVHGLALDHRAGFLLSLIDGVATVDEVLDMSGMPPLDALRLLFEMVQEGVIESDAPLSARAESKNN